MNGYEIVNDETQVVVDYADCLVAAQRRADALTQSMTEGRHVLHTYRPVKVKMFA